MHFHRIHSFTCYLQSGIEHTSLLTSSDYFKDTHTSSKKYDWQLSFVVSCHHHPSRKSPLSHDFFSKTTKIKCVFVLSHVCTHSCLIVDAFFEVIFFFAWKWFLSLDILDYESPSFFLTEKHSSSIMIGDDLRVMWTWEWKGRRETLQFLNILNFSSWSFHLQEDVLHSKHDEKDDVLLQMILVSLSLSLSIIISKC